MTRRISKSEVPLLRLRQNALGFAVAGSIGCTVLSGCGSPDGAEVQDPAPHKVETPSKGATASTPTTQGDGDVGTIGFDLKLGSANVDKGTYQIHGNNYDASGLIDLSHSSAASVIVGGIPFGTGYQATLTAQSSSGVMLNCSGSASFDITSRTMVSVNVPMDCKEAPTVPVPRAAVAVLSLLFATSGMALLRGAARPRRPA